MRGLRALLASAALFVAPGAARAFIFEDWIECAGLFDVLDIENDDDAAFRAMLDVAADAFEARFAGFHGTHMATQLRAYYQELWQSKPNTDETVLELAAALTFCEVEARKIGHAIALPEGADIPTEER